MATSRAEIMRSPFLPAPRSAFPRSRSAAIGFSVPGGLNPRVMGMGRGRRSSNRGVVAAISEEAAGAKVAAVEKKAAAAAKTKTKARAALTVRRKNKEDFKDAIAGHLDALTDMIGRTVVLELISTDVDPNEKYYYK